MHSPRLERFAREFPIEKLENPPFCKVPKQAYRTQFPLGAITLTMPSCSVMVARETVTDEEFEAYLTEADKV